MIILGTNSIKDTGYDVANSARFNDGSSDTLTRTPDSASNRRTFTISTWIKRSNLGSNQSLFQQRANSDNSQQFQIQFKSDDTLRVIDQDSDNELLKDTSAVFRDVSAWMHIVVAVDTTHGTSEDRAKIYVNNTRITDFASSTNYDQNYDSSVNNTVRTIIGAQRPNSSSTLGNYLSGYIAEYVLIDGQQLDPTSFGEFDEDSGIWKPINVSGLTFGTNGFYLDFEDSSALGNDANGSNNFTVNNLTAIDQSTDTCTNNFCTLNPLMAGTSSLTYSEGNLKIVFGASGTWYFTTSTIAATQGKWYCEVKIDAVGGQTSVGIIPMETVAVQQNAASDYMGKESNSIGYVENGKLYKTNSVQETTSTYTTNDIIGIAFNLDDNSIQFYKNGSSVGSAIALTSGLTYVVGVSGYNSSTQSVNFGSPPYAISSGNTDGNGYGNFEYAVPSGYYALNTKKFSGVWIMAYTTIDKPSDYFNTKLYTGNGASSHAISGVGFQPDWTWNKNRSSAVNHALTDSVRGAPLRLMSQATEAEINQTTGLLSFNSDGFTVGSDSGYNGNGNSMVSWNWKKTATAGFDIVAYTGNATGGRTVAHSLSAVPAMIIVKNRDADIKWAVYHHKNTAAPETDHLKLNSTDATADDDSTWNDTAPTSSVFSLGGSTSTNGNGTAYIAYLFAEKQGYSKFGSYTGNGNADGTFVYTGFKPAWVMTKRTDSTSAWQMFDNTRSPSNPTDKRLKADQNSAEDTNLERDFLSNGFKIRTNNSTINGSGVSMIYMAFAENPFVTSSGVPATAR